MELNWNIEYDFYRTHNSSGIRFAIPLNNGQTVYMCSDFDKGCGTIGDHILLLDTQKFFQEWQKQPASDMDKGIQHADMADWDLSANWDKKFAESIHTPISIAWLTCSNYSWGFNFVDTLFNPLEKLLWLIKHQAEYIPIYTHDTATVQFVPPLMGLDRQINYYSLKEILVAYNHSFFG